MNSAYETTSHGRIPLNLGRELWRGGEGAIWEIGDRPAEVAKIMLQGANRFSRSKVEAMIASPPEHLYAHNGGERLPVFAWPTSVIEDPKGQAVGFLMARIDRDRAVSLEKYMTRLSATKALSDEDRSLARRMQVCRNLAAAVAELHSQGHFIVDLKPANVLMFKDTSVVCLIDNDSFSIGSKDGSRFAGSAYSQEYLAPEIIRGALKPEGVINDWQDRFALAVMMFQILNFGIHPFQGTPTVDSEEWNNDFCVRQGYYPYSTSGCAAAQPMSASIHACWDDETRLLFDRTFGASRPSLRVSAMEWRDHFDRMIQGPGIFVRCNQHPNLVTHIHVAGKECPECRHEKIAANYSSSIVNSAANQLPPISNGVSLPPPEPGNKKWLFLLLAIIAAVVVMIILGTSTDSKGSVATAPQILPASKPEAQAQDSPPKATQADADRSPPQIEGSAAKALLAANMETPGDLEAIKARVEILADLVMHESANENSDELIAILKLAIEGNDTATTEAVRSGLRNNRFLAHVADWKRFKKEARKLNEATLANYQVDPSDAALRQWVALALDPLDREIAGNLAIYSALSGNDSKSLSVTLYAMALPRPNGRLVRVADWDMLAASLARQDKPEPAKAAYMVALATTSNLAGFCGSLLKQQEQMGQKLKQPISDVFRRIQERGQSDTENCAFPPQWIANS